MTYFNILTPALILERNKLVANIERMTERLKLMGVNLRPHLKTSKSIEVAQLAIDGNFGGITISTFREAEYFAGHGIVDMILASCISPARLNQAANLRAKGVDLKILIDHPSLAHAISNHSGEHRVLIEIDCGEHRTGVTPTSPKLMEIAHILNAAPNVKIAGVLTHAGHSYRCRTIDEIADIADQERDSVVDAANILRKVGIECQIVSVGSTPTALYARDLTGVTEARPGVYMFGDLFQAGIGSCTFNEIALSVLTTVIAHQEGQNQLLIDAGGLALSKDRSTGALDGDCGYGLVCDVQTGQAIEGLKVDRVHQEHGQITSTETIDFIHYPIGTQFRILPNHSCMTAAGYDRYNVIDGTHPYPAEVTTVWGRCNGW
jgi:D-serine deaminase-like pyridoxal phosphate-dependent protein